MKKSITILFFIMVICGLHSEYLFSQVTLKLNPISAPGQVNASQLCNVTITRTGIDTNYYNYYLEGTITHNKDGKIVSGQSNNFQLKIGTTVFTHATLSGCNYDVLNEKYKCVQTGMCPPGEYKICVVLKTRQPAKSVAEDCITIKIEEQKFPDVTGNLQLVSPADKSELDIKIPIVFTWAATGQCKEYTIKVVELNINQSKEEAIKKNRAIIEKTGLRQPTYQYNVVEKLLVEGKKYAWQVNCGDLKSEAWSFKPIDQTRSCECPQPPNDKLGQLQITYGSPPITTQIPCSGVIPVNLIPLGNVTFDLLPQYACPSGCTPLFKCYLYDGSSSYTISSFPQTVNITSSGPFTIGLSVYCKSNNGFSLRCDTCKSPPTCCDNFIRPAGINTINLSQSSTDAYLVDLTTSITLDKYIKEAQISIISASSRNINAPISTNPREAVPVYFVSIGQSQFGTFNIGNTSTFAWSSFSQFQPNSTPLNFTLYCGAGKNYSPPPLPYPNKDSILFCIRYSFTDENCNTCDTTVKCYGLIRDLSWKKKSPGPFEKGGGQKVNLNEQPETSLNYSQNEFINKTDKYEDFTKTIPSFAPPVQGSVWYFGKGARLYFNPNPSPIPSTFPSCPDFGSEGCAVISDNNGRPIIITDGITVYNRNGKAMETGPGTNAVLHGHSSSTQSAIIIPWPGTNFKKFIIFTVGAHDYGPETGLKCSTVDFTDPVYPDGKVTQINIPLQPQENTSEKLTAIPDGCSGGYWVIAHGIRDNGKDFWVYHVTSSWDPNLNSFQTYTTPMGTDHGVWVSSWGQMKVSPDGSKIAVASVGSSFVEVFSFDIVTGKISDPPLQKIQFTQQTYGIEFSPNGKYLYVSLFTGEEKVIQIDIANGNQTEVAPQGSIESDCNYYFGALQLGPDNKIYVAVEGKTSIDVINNPNLPGSLCGYSSQTIPIPDGLDQNNNPKPGICMLGLPTIIQGEALNIPIPTCPSECSVEQVTVNSSSISIAPRLAYPGWSEIQLSAAFSPDKVKKVTLEITSATRVLCCSTKVGNGPWTMSTSDNIPVSAYFVDGSATIGTLTLNNILAYSRELVWSSNTSVNLSGGVDIYGHFYVPGEPDKIWGPNLKKICTENFTICFKISGISCSDEPCTTCKYFCEYVNFTVPRTIDNSLPPR